MALVILAGAAGAGYKLANRHHAAPPPAHSGQTGVAAAQHPAQIVQAYFYDINHHFFRAAWKLTAQNGSFANFRAGFVGTRHDAVKIIGISGDVVTASLNAEQTDGTVKVFQGTYTVTNGVISSTNVQQLS